MFESKKKNSNSYRILASNPKIIFFIFGKLTSPYVMFESKKTQILIEFLDGMKKVQLVGKKSSARV